MAQKNKANKRNLKARVSKKLILSTILILIIVATGVFDLIFVNRVERTHIQREILRATSAREITHGDTTKKQVIFTFDAGSTMQSGEKILEVLAKHHVKGTFFMTGKFVEANPAFVREVEAAGHEIFNHTYDHPHLPTLTDAEIVAELNRMDTILAAVTNPHVAAAELSRGLSTRPYFRAPYGDRDDRVREVAAKDGYQGVYWTVDAHDWEEPTGETSADVTDRIISNLKPGNIYLMHVGDNITGEVLDQVFTTIEGKGYKLVSLTQGI